MSSNSSHRGNPKLFGASIVVGTVILLYLCIARSSDPKNPEAYVGTWVSGFDDTDARGNPTNTAFLINIRSDQTYQVKIRSKDSGDWRYYDSGSWSMTTTTVRGDPERHAAISLNTMTALLWGTGLNVQDLGGTLRTFTSTRRFSDEFKDKDEAPSVKTPPAPYDPWYDYEPRRVEVGTKGGYKLLPSPHDEMEAKMFERFRGSVATQPASQPH